MMSRSVLFALALCACAPATVSPSLIGDSDSAARIGSCDPIGGTFSGVTFTDEEAQNAIDFADHADRRELEALNGVGSSIANRIIHGRPYASQADPVGSLDAISYVGSGILGSFRDDSAALWCDLRDGRQDCCIDLACESLGGVVESYIEYTDDEAHMVLDWMNNAPTERLTAVCNVGPAMAAEIEAARPVRNTTEIGAIKYISGHALWGFVGLEGWGCATKGSVAEEWCGEAEAECVCDTGTVPAPTEPPPFTGDVFVDNYDALPVEVQVVVDEWAAENQICDSQSRPWDPRFAEATLSYQDGAFVGGDLRMVQMIDPEGGIQYHIFIAIESDYSSDVQGCDI